MTQSYSYQVKLGLNSCPLWRGVFAYFTLNNQAILLKQNGFLLLTQPKNNFLLIKNMYYENNLQKKS